MIYDLRLVLAYAYPGAAANARHLLCVAPSDLPGVQRVLSSQVQILPSPDERLTRRDFFGNSVEEFACRTAHDGISVTLSARVERLDPLPPGRRGTALADLPAMLDALGDLGPGSPLHCIAPSTRVPRSAAMTRFARAALRPGMSALDALMAIGHALHGQMRFDPGATTVDTPAAEAFARRHGVCQDFSHILIGCLRGIGVPAGYVSGFLRTSPPPGQARLEGADAMHAWVRAWCGPAQGWVELDPTNDCTAGADHIVVAYGRDYSDVAPIKGVLSLSGPQTGSQWVDVIPL